MKVGINMKRNIIEPQKSDMGSGYGEYLFPDGTTLGDFLKWYKDNSKTWGTITIIYNDGRILRKFDYDLYNNNICYTHLSWEEKILIKKIDFYYCWMSEDVKIHLNK